MSTPAETTTGSSRKQRGATATSAIPSTEQQPPSDPVNSQTPDANAVVTTATSLASPVVVSPTSALSPSNVGQSQISTAGAPSVPAVSTNTPPQAASTVDSTASTESTPTTNGRSHEISPGQLAGAVVGSVLGTAIIAALVVFLLGCRRRPVSRKRRSRSDDPGRRTEAALRHAEKERTTAGEPRINGEVGWFSHLPHSADDRAIENAVKTFFQQVELHVDNFYQNEGRKLGDDARENLRTVDTGSLPRHIDELASGRSSRAMMKHCMSGLLISKIKPQSDPALSILPAHISAMPSAIYNASSDEQAKAAQQAYSLWKRLSSYLFPASSEATSYVNHREQAAEELSETFATAFAPWVSPTVDPQELQQHGKEIALTASRLGLLMLSQASGFEFQWEASNEHPNDRSNHRHPTIVVFPGLWRTTDQDGVPLRRAELFVAPVTVRA